MSPVVFQCDLVTRVPARDGAGRARDKGPANRQCCRCVNEPHRRDNVVGAGLSLARYPRRLARVISVVRVTSRWYDVVETA